MTGSSSSADYEPRRQRDTEIDRIVAEAPREPGNLKRRLRREEPRQLRRNRFRDFFDKVMCSGQRFPSHVCRALAPGGRDVVEPVHRRVLAPEREQWTFDLTVHI